MALGPLLTTLLKRYGLESLTTWASKAIIANLSPEEIEVQLYEQPAFKTRFPMIFERQANGFGAISPEEVVEYENRAMEVAKSFGTTVTREEISSLIANDVSLSEAQDRLALAGQAVHMASTELKSELSRLYGIDSGQLTRYWLDPKKEAPVLQRQFAAASISEQATRSGWGQLDTGQAEGLASAGLDAAAASEGFGNLVEMEELFESVDDTETDIGTDSQLRLLTGDQSAVQNVRKRGEKRAAKFAEGGSFSTGDTGVAGLGSANT